MFGFISKKKLIKEALELYECEETSKAYSKEDLMYRMGNANALNGLCYRLGINLTKIVKVKRRADNG